MKKFIPALSKELSELLEKTSSNGTSSDSLPTLYIQYKDETGATSNLGIFPANNKLQLILLNGGKKPLNFLFKPEDGAEFIASACNISETAEILAVHKKNITKQSPSFGNGLFTITF